jgi:hypothetical protein
VRCSFSFFRDKDFRDKDFRDNGCFRDNDFRDKDFRANGIRDNGMCCFVLRCCVLFF